MAERVKEAEEDHQVNEGNDDGVGAQYQRLSPHMWSLSAQRAKDRKNSLSSDSKTVRRMFAPHLVSISLLTLTRLVKKSGGLEKASVHWHAVAYANKFRADGHVDPILPERGVFCKRQNRNGHHHDP